MLSGPFHSFLSYGAHISPHVNSVNITDYLFVHFLVNTYTTVRLFFSLPKSVSWVGDDDAAMRSSLTPKQQHKTINRLIVWYALLKVIPNEHDKHEHRSCCRRKKTTTKNRRLENAQHTRSVDYAFFQNSETNKINRRENHENLRIFVKLYNFLVVKWQTWIYANFHIKSKCASYLYNTMKWTAAT